MISKVLLPTFAVMASLGLAPLRAEARVVINEIFYHAPNDIENLEYVELHNSGAEAVDLTGWAISKGVKFKFAAGTKIEAKGYLVLARDAARFKEYYEIPVAGTFSQHLSNSGEHLQLRDAGGNVVDSVRYKDSAPWPTGPDGYSASLERICPEADGEDVNNWASSPILPDRSKPGGTPGKANFNYAAVLPPVVSGVKWSPQDPAPGQAVTVEAEVRHSEPLARVSLLYRTAMPGGESAETTLPMKEVYPDHYSAVLTPPGSNQIVRFRIQAAATSGAVRFFPLETAPRPALSLYVHESIQPARIPFGWIIDTTAAEQTAGKERARAAAFGRFGPGFFNPGPGGNPEDGFARDAARKRLDNALDVSRPWFELSLHQVSDPATVRKLALMFRTELFERRKLADDILDSDRLDEKLESLPSSVEKGWARLLNSVQPLLDAQQYQALAACCTNKTEPAPPRDGKLFADPAAVARSWVKLEEVWFALTALADVDSSRFSELRALFQKFEKERHLLAKDTAEIGAQREGLAEVRERSEALAGKVVADSRPLLSPPQAKELDRWSLGPEVAAGPAAEERPPGGPGPFGGGPPGFQPGPRQNAPSTSGRSAFVYFDPATKQWEVYDFVEVVPRSAGQKIHFHKEQPFHQMTTVNLLFEGEDAVLVEPLAYEVYRRAGVPAEQSFHVRLWIDGQPAGYQLLVEQPNRAFLRRNQIKDDGNLYKILWYEQGVVGQHEKKTRVHSGHDDIVALIEELNKATGDQQWALIRKHFDVEEVAKYFAVNMAISNWDGFFNNYFTYHDLNGSGKWTIFPWDEDQTWGVAMMMDDGEGEVFHTMPLTFGMNGDKPPGAAAAPAPGSFFGFDGGALWWRQPGWFSGPLLANPQFRKVFLAQVKRVAENVYTEEIFKPVLADLSERLRPEVRVRAEIFGQDPEQAVRAFDHRMDRLREHLTKRRAFMLADKEVKSAD